MSAGLRPTAALLMVLAMATFAPHTPALAQSAPATCQYEPGPCPSSAEVQDLGDGADAFSENAGQGTDAVNEALEEPEAPADASTVPAVASATASSASPENGSARSNTEEPVEITVLPETGGAPLTVLGSGVLLATLGLITRKVVGR